MVSFSAVLGVTVAANNIPHDVTLASCPQLLSVTDANYIDISAANTALTTLAVKATSALIDGDNQIAPITGGVAIRTDTALAADDVLVLNGISTGDVLRP